MIPRSGFITLALLLLSVTLVVPQTTTVSGNESILEESEIVLPEELLRVEEGAPEDIEADLPELGDPTMAALDTPLPEAGALDVPRELFDVPPLGGEAPAVADTTPGSLYSNGLFGAGSMSYIIGAISLYRIGATPGFQFDFSHEARDGYNLEEPGNGFFDRNDQIGIAVNGRGDSLGGEVQGRYGETETGFQGLSEFFSATHRRVDGSALMDYAASPIATVTAGGSIVTSQRIYNSDGGSVSPRDSEIVFSPEAGLMISTETTDTTISAGYRFRTIDGHEGTDDLIQTLRGSIGMETSYWTDLIFSAEVGVTWPIGGEAVMPFSLGVTAILTDFLTLEVAGGYETTERSYADAWQRWPYLSITDQDGDLLLRQDAWLAGGSISLNIIDQQATLEAGARAEQRYDVVDLVAYDATSSSYDFDTLTRRRLIPHAALLLEGPWWRSRFSWEAILGERSNVEAPQNIGAELDLFNQNETLRAEAIMIAEVYEDFLAPDLTLAGYVTATEAIEISVELRDIFSFFLDDGRPAVGSEVTDDLPFVEPGFLFAVLTRISL